MAEPYCKMKRFRSEKHSSNMSVMWLGDLNLQEGDIVIDTVTQIIRADVLGSS